MKNLVTIISLFVLFIPLLFITGCQTFTEKFYYSSLDLQLRLIESIHNDTGVPLLLVRLFHNKVVGAMFDIYTIYLRYWEFSFLISFVSILGILGFVYGTFSMLATRPARKMIWVFLFLFLFFPFLEMVVKPEMNFVVKIFIYFLPLYIVAVLGIRKFISSKTSVSWTKVFILGLIIFASIWWMVVYNPQVLKYCSL